MFKLVKVTHKLFSKPLIKEKNWTLESNFGEDGFLTHLMFAGDSSIFTDTDTSFGITMNSCILIQAKVQFTSILFSFIYAVSNHNNHLLKAQVHKFKYLGSRADTVQAPVVQKTSLTEVAKVGVKDNVRNHIKEDIKNWRLTIKEACTIATDCRK